MESNGHDGDDDTPTLSDEGPAAAAAAAAMFAGSGVEAAVRDSSEHWLTAW